MKFGVVVCFRAPTVTMTLTTRSDRSSINLSNSCGINPKRFPVLTRSYYPADFPTGTTCGPAQSRDFPR